MSTVYKLPEGFTNRAGRRVSLARPNRHGNSYLALKRCSECRELFYTARSHAQTCSSTCRVRRWRRLKRELRQIEHGQLRLGLPPVGVAR